MFARSLERHRIAVGLEEHLSIGIERHFMAAAASEVIRQCAQMASFHRPHLADACRLAVDAAAVVSLTSRQQPAVQLSKRLGFGDGRQKVAPRITDAVLHPPFSWPWLGVQ